MDSCNRGNAAITGAAALIGAIIFFSVLWTLYSGIGDVAARSSAEREASDIAAVIDSVGSSPVYCKATYRTPKQISGRTYLLHVRGDRVVVSLNNPAYNGSSVFLSHLSKNFSAQGGVNLTIIKNNGLLEVT